MPTLEQLDAAMLQPGRFVPAVQLRGGGSITMAADSQPFRLVGDDAAVYQMKASAGALLALRCPFEDTLPTRVADAYTMLARGGSAPLHAVADLLARPLALLPDGLSVPRADLKSQTYSVIVMEWIEGTTLRQAVAEARGHADRPALEALAQGWQEAVGRLRAARFIHGDLNDQNVLVDPNGRIRFVDLDTCSWPGSPPPRMLFGTPGYVHPRANTKTTSANRDAFAALVIQVSLQVLAAMPNVHRQTGRRETGFLFSAWDLAHLGSSPVFAELQAAVPRARRALDLLLRACEGSPNDIQARGEWPAAGDLPEGRATAPKAHEHPTTGRLNRDVERFQERWQRSSPGPALPVDDDTAGATRRTDDVQRLLSAFASGDEERVARLWPRTRDDARLSSRAIAIADMVQHHHGKLIANALREQKDQLLVERVREAELAGVAVTASTRRAVRQVRRNIALRERTRFGLEGDGTSVPGERNLLHGLTRPAPNADDQLVLLARRAEARACLNRALRSDVDAAIVAAWEPAILTDDPQLATAARGRIDLAVRRRQWLEHVRLALKARNVDQLSSLLDEAPADAVGQLSEVERRRIDRGIERAAASANLKVAFASGSREAILDAMNRLMASGATLPDFLDWEKVRDVADRESLVRAIREAQAGPHPDYDQLALLLPAARAAAADSALLEDDIDVEELERAVLREDYLRRLRQAMAAADDTAIAAAAGPDLFGALERLTPEERSHVNGVLRRLGKPAMRAVRIS